MIIQYIHMGIYIYKHMYIYICIDVQFLEIIPRSFEIPDPHNRKADEDELAEAPVTFISSLANRCVFFPT